MCETPDHISCPEFPDNCEVNSDEELDEISTVAKYTTVQKEGDREVERTIDYYNLDVIISLGYRVNSKEGIRFRRWATVLKEHLIRLTTHMLSDEICSASV